jgi:CO/xanthine dehydrogenase FAD-binding subunit
LADYLRPASLADALAALEVGPRLILAGGTDIYPARVGRPLDEPVLDIGGLAELGGIAEDGAGWRIGAGVTWTELAETRLPTLFDGLKAAAREVGGRQIQNAGTVLGNLCNASPAADGAPCLLTMEATVELASTSGQRQLPLEAFLLGNRRTARRADELATAMFVPRPAGQAVSLFRKLGARRYLVISIVMLAVVLELDDRGCIAHARVAVGACAPTARRLATLEARLAGCRLAPGLGALVDEDCLGALAPIDDIRATAAYRIDACRTLLRRALEDLGRGAR